MVCRRQATGQMRTSCIPPCPSGRTVARIGAAKDHRRPARASIGRVDDPLPQACNRGSEDDRARRAGIGRALMSAWPDPDRAVIARFLGKLRLRSTRSRTYYRRVLHGFQDVAERHPAIDRQMLEVWLREWGTCWYPSTLLNRARIVDRFLDHLVEKEVIASNPVAVLRGEYGVKHSRPIWQALMSLTPDHALAALRRPRPFGSVLGEIMRDHVALMRGRGIPVHNTGRMVLAVRPVPSSSSGTCLRTSGGHAGTLGGSQTHPQSRRRMRKPEAYPGHAPH